MGKNIKNFSQKRFGALSSALVAGILIIVALSGGFYLFNRQNHRLSSSIVSPGIGNKDVIGWKTYSNSQFGYSLKLPPEFRFEKTDQDTDVEMVTITSPDKSFSINLQSSRSYTVMEDWVKGTFGTTYINQIKVNGDTSSLLRTSNNNYPRNNSYEVGYYVYRNPIFYQLYSQQLKPEYVDLFKTIASTLKTQQIDNKFEISSNNQKRSNTLFNLTSSITTPTTKWRKFTDSFYRMTIAYPSGWKAENLPKNYDNPSTFEISTGTTYSSVSTEKKGVWLRVGDFQQFSTAGGVCYNQICEEVGKATVTIEGKQYSTSIIRASSNKYGDPKQNVFGYYAFQFDLTDKGYSMSGYSKPYNPAVTAYFYTPKEGQTIIDIISTIIY